MDAEMFRRLAELEKRIAKLEGKAEHLSSARKVAVVEIVKAATLEIVAGHNNPLAPYTSQVTWNAERDG